MKWCMARAILLNKMPGDDWQKFANVRALLAFMWTHPGKENHLHGHGVRSAGEWNVWGDLEWNLLQFRSHQGLLNLVDDLNSFYRAEPALWRDDFVQFGFQWIDCSDSRHSVISFMRRVSGDDSWLVVVANFLPQAHDHYRIGVPLEGFYAKCSTPTAADTAAATSAISVASSATPPPCTATAIRSISVCRR